MATDDKSKPIEADVERGTAAVKGPIGPTSEKLGGRPEDVDARRGRNGAPHGAASGFEREVNEAMDKDEEGKDDKA